MLINLSREQLETIYSLTGHHFVHTNGKVNSVFESVADFLDANSETGCAGASLLNIEVAHNTPYKNRLVLKEVDTPPLGDNELANGEMTNG